MDGGVEFSRNSPSMGGTVKVFADHPPPIVPESFPLSEIRNEVPRPSFQSPSFQQHIFCLEVSSTPPPYSRRSPEATGKPGILLFLPDFAGLFPALLWFWIFFLMRRPEDIFFQFPSQDIWSDSKERTETRSFCELLMDTADFRPPQGWNPFSASLQD